MGDLAGASRRLSAVARLVLHKRDRLCKPNPIQLRRDVIKLPSPAGREPSAGAGTPPYARHRPERTLLYQLIEESYPVFKACPGGARHRLDGVCAAGVRGRLQVRTSRARVPACALRQPAFVNEVARFFHATFFSAELADSRSRGGFSQTSLIGVQFHVSPDQRSGRACLAAS